MKDFWRSDSSDWNHLYWQDSGPYVNRANIRKHNSPPFVSTKTNEPVFQANSLLDNVHSFMRY